MRSMLGVIRSEVTKIVTLRSLLGFYGGLLLLYLVIQLASLNLFLEAVQNIDSRGFIEIFVGQQVPAVQEMTEQLVAAMFTPVPLIPVAGAIIAGSEFWAGQIGVSVTATPSRVRLILGKAVATALVTAFMCVVLALATTAVMYPVVKSWNPAILVSGDVLGGYLRVTVVAVCTTLVALGIALMTRRALVAALVMALLLGVTITQLLARVAPAVDAASPISAARNLLFAGARDVFPPLTSGPGTAVLVLLAWAVAAMAGSIVLSVHRDAR